MDSFALLYVSHIPDSVWLSLKDGVTDPGVTLTSCFGFEPLQRLRV